MRRSGKAGNSIFMKHLHPLFGRRSLAFALLFLALHSLPSLSLAQWCPPPLPTSPPWLSLPSQPYDHHWSEGQQSSSAHVYVMPNSESDLGRPFVFVEGIDFGLGAENSSLRNGNFGWDEFMGCNTEAYPMMGYMPVLFDSLMSRGFTPVLVDFEDGTADLMVNARLLADILKHLNIYKTDARPLVVSGASMGGQLARIALKQMELAGEPHCTSLFISLDSPHQGANVPLGLQQMIQFLSGDGGTIDELIGALQSPAARQLLIRQIPGLTPRLNYQDSLDAIGMPSLSRNVAIANGAIDPLSGGDSPILLYDHSVIESNWTGDVGPLFHLEIQPHPGLSSHPLAESGQPLTAHLQAPEENGFPWPLSCLIGHGNASDVSHLGRLDHLPGGTRPSVQQFVDAFNGAVEEADLPWPLCISPIGSGEYQPLHSFIPTLSALDIAPPWPDAPYSEETLTSTTFDAHHIGTSNEPHSQVNPANLSFLLHELSEVESPWLPGQTLLDTNISSEGLWSLPGLNLHGRVGLQSSDDDFFVPSSPMNSHGQFRLQGCSGPMTIHPNGALELGYSALSGQPGSSAHLVLEPHASLVIQGRVTVFPGGTLELLPGAHLHLESGELDIRPQGTLLCHEGALITMEGHIIWSQSPQSLASLDGVIELSANSLWDGHLASNAKMETNHALAIVGSPGADMQLQSPQDGTQWNLHEGAQVDISELNSLSSNGCGLRMMGHGRLQLTSTTSTQWSSMWIGTSSDSVVVDGDLFLQQHHLQGLNLKQSNGRFDAHDCSFQWGSSVHFLCQMNASNSLFSSHPVDHTCQPEGGPNVLQDCQFENAAFGLKSKGSGQFRAESCLFERLGVGIDSQNEWLQLNCSEFKDCDTGVLSNRSQLAMNPMSGGGWNRFEDNDTHLRFIQSPVPDWLGGINHFGNWGSSWAQGNLAVTCNGMPMDLDISGQSWNWPTGWAQVQSGLWATSPSGDACSIQAVDLAPTEPQPCPSGKRPKDQ